MCVCFMRLLLGMCSLLNLFSIFSPQIYLYTLQAERKADPFGQDAAPVPPRVPRGVPVHGTHNAHVPPEAIWVFGQCQEIHLYRGT